MQEKPPNHQFYIGQSTGLDKVFKSRCAIMNVERVQWLACSLTNKYMKIPKWVLEITQKVSDEYSISFPIINWRRSRKRNSEKINWRGEAIQIFKPKRFFSSGVAYPINNKISITAGSEKKDQKLVLLHELAHLIAPKKEHHGKKFWEIAWKLYSQYKVPINYAKQREYRYRKLSRKVLLGK